MVKKQPFQATKIRPLIQIMAGAIKKNPALLDNHDYLMAQLSTMIAGFSDPSKCFLCDASMVRRVRRPDHYIVMLLQETGRIVARRTGRGVGFTEANKVHINSEENIPHDAKGQTGIASALGLIAPVDGMPGHWAITTRGWAGLRGEPVPAWVELFRGAIVGRSETMITFAAVESKYKGTKRYGATYDPREWQQVAGEHQVPLM